MTKKITPPLQTGKNADTTLVTIQTMYPNKINFSISEAAEIFNVSYDFVRERIIAGTIKAVKYGDRMMINIIELTRIINQGV